MRATIALILANVAAFVLLKAVWAFVPDAVDGLTGMLAAPGACSALAAHPWCAVSYMFVHLNFWHLLVNCLWLGWFGALLGDIAGGRGVLAAYLAGGVAGALGYCASVAFAGGGALLVGASAATLSVVAFTLVVMPRRRVALPGGVSLSLRTLSVAGLLLFVCASMEMAAAQTAAHLAGLLAGAVMALARKRAAAMRMRRIRSREAEAMERRVLADKVRRHGYEALTRDEKVRLFNLSSDCKNTSIS